MPDTVVNGLGFLGVRIDDAERFALTVSLYRDVLGMDPFREVPNQLAWFRLGNGTELHVYGPDDIDHTVFGDRPCIGFLVNDVAAIRRRMEAEGVEFLWPTQHDDAREWAHYRGHDGTIYELIGPRTTSVEPPVGIEPRDATASAHQDKPR